MKTAEEAFEEYKKKYLDLSNKQECIKAEYDFKKGFEYAKEYHSSKQKEEVRLPSDEWIKQNFLKVGRTLGKCWNPKDETHRFIAHYTAIWLRDYLQSQQLNQGGDRQNEMYLNMQYYMEHCERSGYVTPKDWIEKHKHF